MSSSRQIRLSVLVLCGIGLAGACMFNESGLGGSSGIVGSGGGSGSAGTGAAGTTGVAGTAALTGGAGTGEVGTSGEAGTTGAAGDGGEAGTTGAAGTTGTAGTTGEAGTTGSAGTTGTAGTTGSAGTTGVAGTTGTAGTTGAAGTTGSAGTGGCTANSCRPCFRCMNNACSPDPNAPWVVSCVSAQIAPTKSTGAVWDSTSNSPPGTYPDAVCELLLEDGRSRETQMITDSLTPAWNASVTPQNGGPLQAKFLMSSQSHWRITVVDRDAADDDAVCSTMPVPTSADLEKGSMVLTNASCTKLTIGFTCAQP